MKQNIMGHSLSGLALLHTKLFVEFCPGFGVRFSPVCSSLYKTFPSSDCFGAAGFVSAGMKAAVLAGNPAWCHSFLEKDPALCFRLVSSCFTRDFSLCMNDR